MQPVRNDSTQPRENPPVLEVDEHNFPFLTTGIGTGVIVGIIMGIYLAIINAASDDPPTGLTFLKHIAFIPFIGMALKRYKRALPTGKIFKDGAKLGFFISLAASFTIMAVGVILWMISPDLSFEQYMNEGNSFADVIVNTSFLGLEVFVFGMIITFCWLQFIKDVKPADG